MYPEELISRISKGETAPLYFLYGDNTSVVEAIVQGLIEVLLPAHGRQFDLAMLDAATHTPADVLQAARTAPFVSPKRVVVVRYAQAFKEVHWEQLCGYCEQPSARCCLVFIAAAPPGKGRFAKSLKKNGIALQCANPRWERDIQKTVKGFLRKHGCSMSPEAMTYCIERIGGNTQLMINELEKVALYCGARKTITGDDLRKVLSGDGDATVFNLVDAIGCGDMPSSLRLLAGLMDEGLRAPQILGMIVRHFRMISRAREGALSGIAPSQMKERLGLHYENIIAKIMRQARGWPHKALREVFREAFQAHCAVRTSGIDQKLILQDLVLTLGRLRGQPET